MVWAPVGLDVVGYMHPERSPRNGDQDDGLQLFIICGELCSVCNGAKVRIEGLNSSVHSFVPSVAAVQLQLTAKICGSSHIRVEYEREAVHLESAVYLHQSQLGPKADRQQAAEVFTPYAPATFATTPSSAPYVSYDPDSRTSVPWDLSLEVLFQGGCSGTTGTKCHHSIASTMGARLRTVAQQLELWFSSSKSASKGACIAHFQLPGHAVPLSVLYPMSISTPAADERTEALHQWRQMLHTATLCSTDRPLFRPYQRVRYGACLQGPSHAVQRSQLSETLQLSSVVQYYLLGLYECRACILQICRQPACMHLRSACGTSTHTHSLPLWPRNYVRARVARRRSQVATSTFTTCTRGATMWGGGVRTGVCRRSGPGTGCRGSLAGRSRPTGQHSISVCAPCRMNTNTWRTHSLLEHVSTLHNLLGGVARFVAVLNRLERGLQTA